MDLQVEAVRMGWMPFSPQFNRNPIEIVPRGGEAGAKTDHQEIERWSWSSFAQEAALRGRRTRCPENWPRVWFIWRGNAFQRAPRGTSIFLRHYLGTHDNAIADETAPRVRRRRCNTARRRRAGKMDLVVDLNFRMDTSALYSDIVLPSASWYEKNDLNSTDLHSYIHPLGRGGAAVLGIAERLGYFQAAREKGQRTGAHAFPRAVAGPGRHAAAARHAG